jgi:hypothetical protein
MRQGQHPLTHQYACGLMMMTMVMRLMLMLLMLQ